MFLACTVLAAQCVSTFAPVTAPESTLSTTPTSTASSILSTATTSPSTDLPGHDAHHGRMGSTTKTGVSPASQRTASASTAPQSSAGSTTATSRSPATDTSAPAGEASAQGAAGHPAVVDPTTSTAATPKVGVENVASLSVDDVNRGVVKDNESMAADGIDSISVDSRVILGDSEADTDPEELNTTSNPNNLGAKNTSLDDQEPALTLAGRVDAVRVDPSADGGVDITVTGDLKKLDVEHADSIHLRGDLDDVVVEGPIKSLDAAGHLSALNAAGPLSKVDAAGPLSKLDTTGPLSKVDATGSMSKLDATGTLSKLDATGPLSKLNATGPLSKLNATGPMSKLDATGPLSKLDATGPLSKLNATGPMSKLDATGPLSKLDATGPLSKVKTSGPVKHVELKGARIVNAPENASESTEEPVLWIDPVFMEKALHDAAQDMLYSEKRMRYAFLEGWWVLHDELLEKVSEKIAAQTLQFTNMVDRQERLLEQVRLNCPGAFDTPF